MLKKLRNGLWKLLAARSLEFFKQKLKEGFGEKGGKAISRVNPDPALKRGALGSPGFTAFIPVINHGAFCGAG